MKNKSLGVLLVVVVVLIVLCIRQHEQLLDLEKRLTEAEKATQSEVIQREKAENNVTVLREQNTGFQSQIGDIAGELAVLRTANAKRSEGRSNHIPVPGDQSDTNSTEGLFGGKGMGKMLQKMMKDPAMKEMMRAQQKATVTMMYGPLFKDLNLSAEEKEKFVSLLADNQSKALEKAQGLFDDSANKTNAVNAFQDSEKEFQANVKDLLGEEKFAQYEDYKKTVGERMQLDQIRQQLADTEWPLRDDQSKQLLGILKEERDKVPPVFDPKAGKGDFTKAFSAEVIEKQMKWQEDYNHRVLERAGQVLSPEQVKEYTEYQERQMNMQKLGMKMALQMFGTNAAPEK